MKIINKNEFKHKQLKNPKKGDELFSLSHVISEHFGSNQVFITHDIIAPHKSSSSPHRHSLIEEIVFVSKGELTIWFGSEKQQASEGSFIFFDPKDTFLHSTKNETNTNVETITFSINRINDIVIYDNEKTWVPPTLVTARLILRPITMDDADSIFAYAQNPNVSKLTLWAPHQTIQDTKTYINNYILAFYSKGVPEPLGITLKENLQKVIGTVGCFWTSKEAKAMELAYALSEDHWGKGIAAEAAKAITDYCFREFSLKRIQARCKAENTASAAVMKKIGMTYEGTLKSAIFHRDRFWDMQYYAKVIE